MRRHIGAAMAGYAAFALAVDAGVPVWVDWPSWVIPADATDIGVLVALAALALTAENAKLREALQKIAGRPGEGVEYISDHGDETCSEARHMELIARAALETDNG